MNPSSQRKLSSVVSGMTLALVVLFAAFSSFASQKFKTRCPQCNLVQTLKPIGMSGGSRASTNENGVRGVIRQEFYSFKCSRRNCKFLFTSLPREQFVPYVLAEPVP